ncbi:MAG TPA: ATP-binding cassette domain-containing protein [Vicinamibacterales bacterium]|nr:ATP-binding cassette domain-containing protein [Vicinamibacterales bacterium]
MIEIRHLHKRYGVVTAVDDASFVAADGAITGLLGENGAGKTTTLRTICGLLTPDSGSIQIDGAENERDAVRRRIGALLTQGGLYSRLTARENITYFGELQGLPRHDVARRADELLAAWDLGRIADRPAGTFSQGEGVRVAIARALVHAPRNVVLDEPTNGLDVPTVRALRGRLGKMRDAGCCVVFSSHVLAEVSVLCDHIVILSCGRVVSQGSIRSICQQAGAASLEEAFLALTGRTEVIV